MQRTKSRLAAIPVALGLIISTAGAVRAQGDPAEVAASTSPNLVDRRPRNLLLLLNNLVYDTDDRPPLVVVDAARWLPLPYAPLPEGSITITPLANRAGLRLVSAGHGSALVPPMMTLLNDKPTRANPFAGMRPDETLKLLLGTLDHAQWRLIGGAGGIGQGDLTDDQRLLWDEIVPASMQVQKSTLQPGKEPGSWEYTDTTFLPVEQPGAIRIRLNRHTTFRFYKSGSTEIGSLGDPYRFGQAAGQIRYTLRPGSTKAAQSSRDTPSAYGVALTTTQTNRLKPSAVDYNSPSLDPPISLHFPPGPPIAPSEAATNAEMPAFFNRPEVTAADMARLQARAKTGPDFLEQYQTMIAKIRADAAVVVARKTELPTVSDILLRISQATRFEFVADRRVRDSLVFSRGDSARSGDVLQALARSVTGAFRKIDGIHGGRQIYLLTCDIEGVGTRAARLEEWADAAEELKYKVMDGIIKRIAVNDPLSLLTFAPDDKYALSAGEARMTEENWQLDKDGPEIKRDDLSPALKDAVDAFQTDLTESGISLRNDRIQVGEELSLSLIVPGIGPVEDIYTGQGIAYDFLRQISRNPARVDAAKKKAALGAKSSAAPPPVGFPAKLKRRILLIKPATSDEAAALVRMAAKKGITDVWLSVRLADVPTTVALMQSAIKAGAGRISVGAAVSLLQNGGIPGEPERNIEGETGDEYRLRSQSKWVTDADKASHDYDFDQYKGWIVPDRPEMTARLKTLATIPGLAGLVLLSTAAPGWTGEKQGGDDILTELGYSVETRRQFLSAYGIDPIDIPIDSPYLENTLWNLGPFYVESANENYTIVNHRAVPGPADAVPRSSLLSFRAKENIHMLAGLYAELKRQSPHLPLLLDDRVSPYGIQRPLSWFGSWDAGDRVPVNPPFAPPGEGHAAARQASKTIFADWGWWWSAADAKKDGAPASFALKATAGAYRNGPPAWDGMAMDMTNVPTADLLRLLDGLPPVNGSN